MTSRYALSDIDQLRDRFAPNGKTPKGVKPHYNISPTMRVPVIVSRDGALQIERMVWGFVPVGARDMNSVFRYKTYAVRSEKILETHTSRTALRSQRCLIPANGFYEWKRSGDSKKPFYIHPHEHGLFGFAGIYSLWIDPDGTVQSMCALITIDSETIDDDIPSRLPIIVDRSDEADWLNPELNDLSTMFRIMRPFTGTLDIIPVSDSVNSLKANSPDLITRL